MADLKNIYVVVGIQLDFPIRIGPVTTFDRETVPPITERCIMVDGPSAMIKALNDEVLNSGLVVEVAGIDNANGRSTLALTLAHDVDEGRIRRALVMYFCSLMLEVTQPLADEEAATTELERQCIAVGRALERYGENVETALLWGVAYFLMCP